MIKIMISEHHTQNVEPGTLLLQYNNWNDYGYYTSYDSYYVDEHGERKSVGLMKIYCKSLDVNPADSHYVDSKVGSYIVPKDNIDQLSTDFCSLGQRAEYYQLIKQFFPDDYNDILRRLRDMAANEQIRNEFLHYKGVEKSLLRDINAKNLISDNTLIMDNLPSHSLSDRGENMHMLLQVTMHNKEDVNELPVVGIEQEDGNDFLWKPEDNNLQHLFLVEEKKNENGYTYHVIYKDALVQTSDEDIVASIREYRLRQEIKQTIDNADGLDEENVTSVITEEMDPYDPKLIRVEPKIFSIQYICSLIDSGDLSLSADFQREFVWSDITRKSRLIESILLRIPIPLFYLLQDENGRFEVVDGLQRLTVIHDFVNNKFRLKNVEYLKDCEGKFYNKKNQGVDPLYVKRIDQTQLTFNIIDPQTPQQVRYDIFRRINTGGKTLNNQEIRNCMEKPHVRKFLKTLTTMQSFLSATRGSINPQRMADREMVLRFVSFYLLDHDLYQQSVYKGDMDYYLDRTVDLLNARDEKDFDRIKEAFDRAMKNAYTLFGSKAFRKSVFINKALFLSWSRVLCDYEEEIVTLLAGKTDFYEKLKNTIEQNDEYNYSLSMSTNDVKRVEYNYKMAGELLKEVLNA